MLHGRMLKYMESAGLHGDIGYTVESVGLYGGECWITWWGVESHGRDCWVTWRYLGYMVKCWITWWECWVTC